MNEIKIDPRADRRAVLEALIQALDVLDPDAATTRALAPLLRGYVRGDVTQRELQDRLLQSAQRGCQQAGSIGALLARAGVKMPEAIAEQVNVAIAQSFMDLGFILVASAAQHRDEAALFLQVAAAALRPLQAVAAQLQATEVLRAMEVMFTAAAAPAPEPTDEIGRNRPCACGSGEKYKKCCGARR